MPPLFLYMFNHAIMKRFDGEYDEIHYARAEQVNL